MDDLAGGVGSGAGAGGRRTGKPSAGGARTAGQATDAGDQFDISAMGQYGAGGLGYGDLAGKTRASKLEKGDKKKKKKKGQTQKIMTQYLCHHISIFLSDATDRFYWQRGSVFRTSVFGRQTFPDLRLIHG